MPKGTFVLQDSPELATLRDEVARLRGELEAVTANVDYLERQNRALCIDRRVFNLNAEALAEIKATLDGNSTQSVQDIVNGLLEELSAPAKKE